MSEPGQCSLNLAHIVNMYQGESKSHLVGHLLHSQAAAVSDCVFEKLRGPGSVEFAKKFLPPTLRAPDFMDPKKWSLALQTLNSTAHAAAACSTRA